MDGYYYVDTRLLEPDVSYILLPPEPQLSPELMLLRERLSQAGDSHVILDLCRVEIITSPSIGHLLLLQKQLAQQGRRLVLCNVHLATKCVFRVAGLDALLNLAEDKFEAQRTVRQSPVGQSL